MQTLSTLDEIIRFHKEKAFELRSMKEMEGTGDYSKNDQRFEPQRSMLESGARRHDEFVIFLRQLYENLS